MRQLAHLPAFGGVAVAGASAAAGTGAAGARGNGGSLLRKLRGLGADTATKCEGSWRRHSTRSLDAQHVLVTRQQQVMQGLAIIRMYAAVVGGIISFVAFFEGPLKRHAYTRAVRKIFKLDRSIWRLRRAG